MQEKTLVGLDSNAATLLNLTQFDSGGRNYNGEVRDELKKE
jgi:hypothetical protein